MSEAGLRRLPQQDGGWFLTDGGIETVLIYQDGIALQAFGEDAHFLRGLNVAALLRNLRAALVSRQRVGSAPGGRQRAAECLPGR